MEDKFYLTTPIYYPSDRLHIGHSYTTVAADTLARYKKLRGYDVMFVTGTDDHGQKIERVAAKNGKTPQKYVDEIVDGIKELWRLMEIDYDIFIRTSDDYHIKGVQKIFRLLYEKGDIYKSVYEDWYCTECETFFTERQLVDGKCPDCSRGVEKVKEESYFFRISKYQKRLERFWDENPDFILPLSRKNEMVNNFLKPGLEDLCVSRTSFTWGIPVDFDPGHVVYVWIDALSNYITALGYGGSDETLFRKYWPADIHLMAKEIVRFHAVIWPIMLMALDLPLPKGVFGHGWITIDDSKMSKSKGNVVDPKTLVERYGLDAVRYFILREFSFGQDGAFSNEALLNRINSDLANDLGNLLSRTVGMIDKYFGGALPEDQRSSPFDGQIEEMAGVTVSRTAEFMDKYMFHDALAVIWKFIRRLNKYADENEPWALVKDESKKAELAGVMYVLAEGLRIVSMLISPFMPRTPGHIWRQLGINDENSRSWTSIETFGVLHKNIRITKGDILFPRIDIKKELALISELS
ncbi:MAG: methionine--tRNA ligase [Clostridiales bacterium]|jgi:methionyl-tRNA synthetase|nr:methionine--tRNA ligase [Clostridiales bacterium]